MKSPLSGHSETLYSVAQIRKIEQKQAENSQTYLLMEEAGKAAFKLMKKTWPDARKVLVLSGRGNNGGDGYVLARLATQERYKATLCQLSAEDKIQGDALIALNRLPHSGLNKCSWSSVDVDDYDVIIDAMLGTGVKGALREPYIKIIEQVNCSKTPVLSIDIPSGVEADSGYVDSIAVKAQVTATFVGHKKGLFTGQSSNFTGKVRLFPLGIQQKCYPDEKSLVIAENWNSIKSRLKPRLPATHKGDYGHCLIIGGAKGMTGAAVLAASAAARTGSGLVSAYLQDYAETLITVRPEVMAKNVALAAIKSQLAQLSRISALVIGPGLGQSEWSACWMDGLYHSDFNVELPKVIDADGLNWLSHYPNFDTQRILTPHPGEAGRLLGISSDEVNRDRFAASYAIAEKFGGVCILKGSGTIISQVGKPQIVCPVGNPGMASGGMGDVLSGIVGALLAQGFSLLDAALLGVCLHGEAGDRVAGPDKLYRGMLASDLIQFLPLLMNPHHKAT